MPVKVMIVDDQPLIRDGLKTLLGLEKSIDIVGIAANGDDAVKLVEKVHPEVILLDIRMPGMNGIDCLKEIKKQDQKIKILILTTFNDDEYIINALAYGACGYLLKDVEIKEIVDAIHDAAQGKMVMPSDVTKKLAEGLSKLPVTKEENSAVLDSLSDREKEVAVMLAQGFTNKQISNALYISDGTVRNYISSIYDKIGISDRVKAVMYLKEMGIK
ncbi:MAG: response regulator transcription factor [Bacillota bacterium]|nr:response regulator transcription factor [Bacillota bacterium]